MARRWTMTSALMVCLVACGPAFAGELGLAPMSAPVWAEAADAVFPREVRAPADAAITEALAEATAQAWPGPYAVGQARSASAEMRTTLGDLLHVGARVSRAQLLTTRHGTEKTVVTLYLTESVFILNLATGEVLANRSLTCPLSQEFVGVGQALPADVGVRLLEADAPVCTRALVQALGERLRWGTTQAEVVGVHQGEVVVARGYMDGAYVGEVLHFAGAPADGVRLSSVQPYLALGRPISAREAHRGDLLERVGAQVHAGAEPRVMVLPGDPTAVIAPNVTEADLAQWTADALEQAGFVVLPHTQAMFSAKELTAAGLDVVRDVVVGAQVAPDLLVMPFLASTDTYQAPLDAIPVRECGPASVTGGAGTRHCLEARLGLAFLDGDDGAVLFGTSAFSMASIAEPSGGRTFLPGAFFPAVVQNAALDAAQAAARDFRPARAYAKVSGGIAPNGTFGWTIDGQPLGVGAIGELLARGPDFTDSKGRDLGFVEDVVGTLRVVESGDGRERAVLLASTAPVAAGMRVRAIPGAAHDGDTVVGIGEIDVRVEGAESGHASAAAMAALYAAPHLRMVLGDAERERLERFQQHMTSGDFALHDVALESTATHLLQLSLVVRVSAPARAVLNVRKGEVEVSRELELEATASLIRVADGAMEPLEHPSTHERFESYNVRYATVYRGNERPGLPVTVTEDEVLPASVDELVFESTTDLARKIRLMLESASSD